MLGRESEIKRNRRCLRRRLQSALLVPIRGRFHPPPTRQSKDQIRDPIEGPSEVQLMRVRCGGYCVAGGNLTSRHWPIHGGQALEMWPPKANGGTWCGMKLIALSFDQRNVSSDDRSVRQPVGVDLAIR